MNLVLLGHCQQYVRIVLALLQSVHALGLALRSGLQKHCFGPKDACRWDQVIVMAMKREDVSADILGNWGLPELGHSCRALAMSVLDMFFKPPLYSRRTDSSLERTEEPKNHSINNFEYNQIFVFLPQFGALWIF